MKKVLMLTMFIVSVFVFIIGCSETQDNSNINDFFISYLEKQDNKLLVEDQVMIKLEAKDAKNVKLNIKEYGQEEIYHTIEGQEVGGVWEFIYENSDPFTNEVWLVVYYDDAEMETEKKVITNMNQSYETAFESIIPIFDEMEEFNILSHEVNLEILGWYDDKYLLARDNDDLVLYDIYHNIKEKIMDKNAWNIYPSPDFQKLIYQDESGLQILDLNTKHVDKLMNMNDNSILKDLTWSWDQNKVVFNIFQENQDNAYIVMDMRNNSTQIIDLDLQGYELDDLIYLDNNYIFALANQRIEIDSDGGFEDFKVLISVDIDSKRVKDYTPKSDIIDDIRLLSQINNREFLVRISTSEISEESINRIHTMYLLNTEKRDLKVVRKDIDSPYIYSLSPDKEQYIYLQDIEDGNENLNEMRIILGEQNKDEIDIFRTITDYPRQFYWSKDHEKIAFYIQSGREIYLIEKS